MVAMDAMVAIDAMLAMVAMVAMLAMNITSATHANDWRKHRQTDAAHDIMSIIMDGKASCNKRPAYGTKINVLVPTVPSRPTRMTK